MSNYIRGQQGSITALSLAFMVVLAISLAGVFPYVSSLTKTSATDQQRLQAQYAAEAGAKRAIASFSKLARTGVASDWAWVGVKNSVSTDGTQGTYTVTIKDANKNNFTPSGPVPDQNYTVTSIGEFKTATQTAKEQIYIIIPVAGGTVTSSAVHWAKDKDNL